VNVQVYSIKSSLSYIVKKKLTKEGESLSHFLCSKKQNQAYSRSFGISIMVEQYKKNPSLYPWWSSIKKYSNFVV